MKEQMLHLHAPHSAGRLPLRIGSGFAVFTADQWRNWTIGYSPIVLRQVLPSQYWLLFVNVVFYAVDAYSRNMLNWHTITVTCSALSSCM